MEKTKRVRRWALLCMALLLACFLTGCGSEALPETYPLDKADVPAIIKPNGDVEAKLETEAGEEGEPSTYTYSGLTQAGALVSQYADALMAENGFLIVDEATYLAVDAPDFMEETGKVCLARVGATAEDHIMVLLVEWTAETCSVVTDVKPKPEGFGPKKEEPEPAEETPGQAQTTTGGTYSFEETIAFFQEMNPKTLGLPGESMEDYNVYVMEGLVRVGDETCLCVKIYNSENVEETNDYQGTFFLSRDGKRMYRLDPETNKVREIER